MQCLYGEPSTSITNIFTAVVKILCYTKSCSTSLARNPRSFLRAFLCSASKSVMTVSTNSFLCNSFVSHFSCTVEPAAGFTTKAPQLLGRYRGSKIELNQSSPCMSGAKSSIPDVERLPSTCGRAGIYSIFGNYKL